MTEDTGKTFARRLVPLAITLAASLLVALALPRMTAGGSAVWTFVKLGLALGTMVLLLREEAPVGLALLAGSFFIGLAFELSPTQIGKTVTFGVLAEDGEGLPRFGISMVRLSLLVFLINFLGHVMLISGGMRLLVESMERTFRDVRWVMAGVPAIIGLLPMPGGAMLSAPMVGELGERVEAPAELKATANYWFRHVWEWWWPIYPAILVMLEQDYITFRSAVTFHGPLSLVAIFLGWLFVLRRISRRKPESTGWRFLRELWLVFQVLWPVFFVVLAMVFVRLPKPYGDWVLPAALIVADAGAVLSRRLGKEDVLRALKAAASWKMTFLIYGVCVLRGAFELSGAAASLPSALEAASVPPIAACFVAPFAVNLVTGYNLAGVSMAFPLLLGIFKQIGPAAVTVAYAGSFLGMMTSPVHLCLALTREYFKTDWGRTYRRLMPLLLGQFAAVLVWVWWLLRAG